MSTSAVAGASTVYMTVNQAQNVDTPEVTLNTDSLQVEKCLRYEDKIQTILRNTGTKPVNISQATILINDQVKNNFKVLKNQIIKPDRTTKIQFTENQEIQTYKITQPQTGQTKTICNIIQQPDGQAPTPINQIPEGGGQTASLAYGTTGTPAILPTTARQTEPFSPTGSICFGNQCDYRTGLAPTSYDDDGYLTKRYDVMNGSIKTSEIVLNKSETKDFCIGSKCGDRDGDDSGIYGEQENDRMDGPVFVDDIVADGSMCVGDNC